MEISLKDRIAIITGATSGIGYATALQFAESGAKLMLTGRNETKLQEIQSKLGKPHQIISGEITNQNFRNTLISKTVKTFGKLDILVNSAGIIDSGSVETTSLDDYDKIMDVNLRAVIHLTQLAIPHLIETKGNVVNVSSVAGVRAFPGLLAYCISKAGLDQFTRVAALDLAAKGVRVNAVNPGVVVTNLHRRSGMSENDYQKFLKHSKLTHPLGRAGEPEEIADLITFLASENAAWITGATHSIDGGRHQTCLR